MTSVAERAGKLLETKTIRRVRTEAGVRRYKQPIGSIIINDSLLVGLTVTGDSKVSGAVLIDGADGKKYAISKTRLTTSGRTVYRAYERGGEQREIYEGPDETEAYARLAQHVQQEAGIDMSSGRLPGSSGKREGWSKNQIEGANDSIYGLGNSATDNGNDALAFAMWNVGGELNQHGDIRKARHDLEQLKKRDDLNLDQDLDGMTGMEVLDAAISGVITEGKLKKRYDEAEEAEYAAGAADRATERAGTPQPVKTSELSNGMWVRKVDKDGNPATDWLKIRSIAEQGVRPGSSRLIDTVDRNGKKLRLYRQSPRDKWETIADPKDQPSYEEVQPPPTNVVKRVDRLQERDYTTIGGETGYVGKYGPDKTDETVMVDGKKRAVYSVALYDDEKLTQNKRVVKVPAGTMSGATVAESKPTDLGEVPSLPEATQRYYDNLDKRRSDSAATRERLRRTVAPLREEVRNRRGDLQDTPEASAAGTLSYTSEESEYEGFSKYKLANGQSVYVELGPRNVGVFDADDNRLSTIARPSDMHAVLDTLGRERPGAVTGHPDLTMVKSEYPGYTKLEGTNGSSFYLAEEDGKWSLYDDKDNLYVSAANKNTALSYAQKMGAGDYFGMSEATRNFRSARSEYEGYGKFVGADGNNYYADLNSSTDDGGINIYDADDNLLRHIDGGQDAGDKLQKALNELGDPNRASKPTPVYSSLSPNQSEYPGYDKYVSESGIPYYGQQRNGKYTIVDADDNEVGTYDTSEEAWSALNADLGGSPLAAPSAAPTGTVVPMKRLKSKYQGWKRFRLADKRVVDTGQATEDDGRWYATGPGGWNEILADGDTEEDMMNKLRALNSIDQPVTFSPSNTDVVPKREATPSLADMDAEAVGAALFDRLEQFRPASLERRTLARVMGDLQKGEIDKATAARELRNASRLSGSTRIAELADEISGRNKPRGKTNVPLSDDTQEASPIAGMTREQYDAARKRADNNTRRAVLGMNAPSRGRGTPGPKRDYSAPVDGVLPQDPETQRQQDEAERRLGRTNVGSQLDDFRNAREGIAADRRAREQQQSQEDPLQARIRELDREARSAGYVETSVAAKMLEDRAADMSNQWSDGSRQRVRDIAARMKDGTIGTQEAYRRLDEAAKALEQSPDFRLHYDGAQLRNVAQWIGPAAGRPGAPKARPATAEEIAARDKQRAADVASSIPRGWSIRDLDNNEPVFRNGRQLTAKDRDALNTLGVANNHRQNRLKAPSSRNLNDRLGNFQDEGAITAIQDKATENYLRQGMTSAAAWKAAIEEAESLADKDASKFRVESDSSGGRSTWVLYRKDPDGRDVRLKSSYRRDEVQKMAAEGNQRERSRVVRGMNAPTPTPGRSDAPAATTAGARAMSGQSPEARTAEVQSNIERIYDDLISSRGRRPGDNVSLRDIRPRLDELGYSRAEQDRALIEFTRDPRVNVFSEMNQKTLTQADRDAAVSIGNQDKHHINIRSFVPTTYDEYVNGPASSRAAGLRNPNSVDVTFNPSLDTRRVEEVAATITSGEARQLARVEPARFLRVMATRDLKQGRNFDDFREADYKRAYLRLMQYAQDLEDGQSGRLDFNTNDIYLNARSYFSNTPAADRILQSIINVLEEEQGR